MTQGMKNTVKVLVVFLVVCGLCALAVLLVINPNNVFGFQENNTETISEGEKYIQSLEAEPTGPIEEAIFSKRKEREYDLLFVRHFVNGFRRVHHESALSTEF